MDSFDNMSDTPIGDKLSRIADSPLSFAGLVAFMMTQSVASLERR